MSNNKEQLNDSAKLDISYRDTLLNERDELKRAVNKNSSRNNLIIFATTMLLFFLAYFTTFLITQYDPAISKDEAYEFGLLVSVSVLLVICLVAFILPIKTKRSPKAISEDRIIAIDEELQLLDISEKDYEKRAEIQFKNHQKEIKRYYDLNIVQLKRVFALGMGTIVAGIFLIIYSTQMFLESDVNILPAVIGSVSGILVDFIGAIFIKMYIETVKASTEFHKQLIHSNDNLYASVMVTKINDEKKRDDAYAELAKTISKK